MPNRLANEASPYLLQHANNPVDWYPWGPEALERAKSEGKPILLSVGYAACHWCHVMEHESFEDEATARVMNEGFVCIKVDREERPDLDEVYMGAVQAFTGGHGGWPMTVFLAPDGRPFMGGTYFPPFPRSGMPSFRQVLDHARHLWTENRESAAEVGRELADHIAANGRLPKPADALTDRWLARHAEAFDADFDEVQGGHGGAPKFPPHAGLAALLAHWRRTGAQRSLQMATLTLDAMARGGMADLAGGGFARYSVDEEWRIPHFEKMLYDNAQLVPVYVDAWKITGKERYARAARGALDWVLRDMADPAGGFHASLDADSDGEEGLFYCWTPREVREVLGFLDGSRVCALLAVTDFGTFEQGRSVLRLETPWDELTEADRALLDRALPALRDARARRVGPGKDDKVVTAWNALTISALVRAGAAFGDARYLDAARKAADFLLGTATANGRLLRSWKGGRNGPAGFLDDHALLVLALCDLYEGTFEKRWLAEANRLADETVRLFWDEADGGAGLFYAGSDTEAPLGRSKHLLGGAEPSPNGAAALAFLRLRALCGRDDLGLKGERVLRCYEPLLDRATLALGLEAVAAAWATGPTAEIAIAGDDSGALEREVRRRYLPFAVLARAPGDAGLLPWLEGKSATGGAAAFVCTNRTCLAPATSVEELGGQLDRLVGGTAGGGAGAESGTGRDRAPGLPIANENWLNTDRPLPLEALRGNVVVLDFWTYCCINCMHVLPELAAVEEQFAGEPVVVIGVHSAKFAAERERENVARAIRRHRIRHPVVHDPAHRVWEQYAVRSWPTVMVLDATGRIAWKRPGEVDREELGAVVRRLLDEARAAGTLGTPAWRAPQTAVEGGFLRHPGKAAVWPDPQAQATGADPFSLDARIYVADTGHDRVIEARLARGLDGWPRAGVLRVFGTGEAGRTDGAREDVRFREPQGMARWGHTLWVADTGNHALRAIELTTGKVSTVAGTGRRGRGHADASKPRELALRSPWDVAPLGVPGSPQPDAVLIAMAGTHQVWAYLPERDRLGPFLGSGREDHVDGPAGEAALAQPSALSMFGGHLFFADSETSSIRLFDLAQRQVGTLCGRGLFDFGDQDGGPEEALLQHPLGVVAAAPIGGSGAPEVYVADTFNHKVKAIDLGSGAVRTLAGGTPDVLCEPGGIAVAGEFLVLPDTNNHRLRAVHRRTGEVRDLPMGE